MRDLMRIYRPYRLWMMGGIGLALLTVLANFGLLALAGWFLASTGFVGVSSYAAQNAFNFFVPSAGVRFFATLRVLARYLGRLVDHEATLRQLAGLRSFFYARIEPLAPAGLLGERSGDLVGRLVADIDRLGEFHLRVFAPFAVAFLAALAMALLFWALVPATGLALLFGLILAGLAVPLATQALGNRPSRHAVALKAAMRADVVDAIQGMAELLTYGAAPAFTERIDRANRALIAEEKKLAAIAGLGAAATTLVAGLTMLAMLLIGGALILSYRLGGADLPLFILGALAAFEAVAPLPQAFQYWGGMREAARRVFAILDRPPPVAEPIQSPKRPARLDLALKGVRLRYGEDGPWVLDGLDLVIGEGEHVAILGRSGAGKTSLLNLLLRFAPYQAGSVTIGGVELSAVRGEDMRSLFTVVSQKSHLFAGSIRDNLLIAKPDAEDRALWQALESAQLAAFVHTLPEGLDSLVGEAGTRLSGGEARRLALARAALRASPFLILDEPTEGLDPLTAAAYRRDLDRLTVGRTRILITHRLVGVADADRVVLIAAGRVVEDGRYADLRRTGRLLPRLAELEAALARI
jgi:ATP-binding cassette subfamily C protein CydC